MAETNGKLISELKVHELRTELISRGLDGNGVKAALVARLEKALSEQGVDINSYLFSSGTNDTNATSTPVKTTTTTSVETKNNDSAAAVVAAASSEDETGKKKAEEPKEEAVPEIVVKTEEAVKENKTAEQINNPFTADDLIEKIEEEIDEAELHDESEEIPDNPAAANGNDNAANGEASPDIGDLEEREDSEGDEAVKNESIPMETESENKVEQQLMQQISAIHDISDEEDLDEDMLTDETTNQKDEKNEDEKPVADVKSEIMENKVKQEPESPNKEAKVPVKSRIPAGLNFPQDDPNGLRCIWIRALDVNARLSELKLAFIDAGFTVESAKIFTTKQQSSRPSAFGFMTLSSQEGAKNAVAKMNNSIFKGKVITVERACDASMLASSDLLPSSKSSTSSQRPKVHPPIKPPEDDKHVSESNRSRIISTSKSSRAFDNSHSRSERHRSPYMNSVNRARIIRAEPQRIVESSGRSIRVVTSRDSSRSSRPSRHSPVRPRERTPPRRHHRSPDRDRIVDNERRKFEDIMRKKEEEFKRKEEALRIEAERNRIKLEKERLEKENLELKLKLQQEQLRATTNVSSSSRRGPSSPHSTSRHRGNTPPLRRSSPPRSSRVASPPRHHSSSSRRSLERHEIRHHTTSSASYRQDPPPPPKETYSSRRRSRSPLRTNYDRSRPDDYSRGSRPQERGSSRHRAESPVRNVVPTPAKYERHSPRRNYEPSRSDRSRRTDPPIEEPSRSSRSSRNGGGGGSGRDFPSNNYDRPSNGSSSFGSRRDSGSHFIPPPVNNIPVSTYNLTSDYRTTAVNPSYSTTPGNSRNQMPVTNSWPQQNYAATNQQPQSWAHQPQNIANIPQWNPFNSSGGMRGGNTGNQRYGGF